MFKDPVSEQKEVSLQTLLEDFPDEKIKGLAVATSVYVSQFSQDPFNESWILEDEKGERELSDPQEIYRTILSCLTSPESISLNSHDGLEYIVKSSEVGDEEFNIRTEYPFSKILDLYIRDIQDPKSVVLVKYSDLQGKQHTVNLSSEEIHSDPQKVIAVGRYRNIESSVRDSIKEEIQYYFNSQSDLEKILPEVKEVATVYLGEVADLSRGGFMLESLSYTKKHFKGRFPNQVVYLTLPGSSIVKNEDRLGKTVVSAVLKMIYGRNSTVEEKKFEYENPDLGRVFVYLYDLKGGENND